MHGTRTYLQVLQEQDTDKKKPTNMGKYPAVVNHGQKKETEHILVQGQGDELSNFHDMSVKFDGKIHNTAEHAYQYTKAVDHGRHDIARKIDQCDRAVDAKTLGGEIRDSYMWNRNKYMAMTDILLAKCEQQERFRTALANTGGKKILHTVSDCEWGIGCKNKTTFKQNVTYKGENAYGKILQTVRSNISRNYNLYKPTTNPVQQPREQPAKSVYM